MPKPIRERLRLRPGDLVDFVVTEDGEIHVRAGRFDVTELRGMLRKPGRRPVSVERMDDAIRAARGRHP